METIENKDIKKSRSVIIITIIMVFLGIVCLFLIQNNLEKHLDNAISSIKLLKNKNVVVFGDSIAYGQINREKINNQAEINWPKYFEELTQAHVDNRAIPGTCLAVGKGYGITDDINSQAFCNLIDKTDLTGADYALIAYGTNDYGFNIPMGAEDVDDKTIYSKNAFKDALHYVLTKLSSDYPNLKVILVTPMYAPTSKVENKAGYTMSDYVEAIKDVASQYGVFPKCSMLI